MLLRLLCSTLTLLFLGGISFAEATAPADGSAPATAKENAPPPLVFRQAGGFSIVSYDAISADHLAGQCNDLLGWFSGQFRWPDPLQPYDIRVDLVPPFETDWSGPYQLKVEPSRINLLIRWGKDTREADVQRALVHALLARIYQKHGAPQPDVNVPGWLVLSCQKEVFYHKQPALLELWARQARNCPTPALARFTEEKIRAVGAPVTPTNPAEELQAFWFRRILQQEQNPSLAAPALLRSLARGYPLRQLLAENLPKEIWNSPYRQALWLPVRYQQITRAGAAPTFSMQESREYLRHSQRFVFPVEGKPIALDPAGLLALRDRKEIQAEVFRRHAKLRIDIARANPVWWNAWHSYGLFLEHFPSASEADLRQLWQLHQADIQDARQLENDIRRALNQPPTQP